MTLKNLLKEAGFRLLLLLWPLLWTVTWVLALPFMVLEHGAAWPSPLREHLRDFRQLHSAASYRTWAKALVSLRSVRN